MLFSPRNSLSIIQTDDESGSVSFEKLAAVLFERPSNIVYCEKDGRLYGIISMGDVHRASGKKHTVQINTSFTYLRGPEYIRSRKIFRERKNINALPIVDEQHRLIGDLSRWDDAAAEHTDDLLMDRRYAADILKKYRKAAIVAPSIRISQKTQLIRIWRKLFAEAGVETDIISKEDILRSFASHDMVFFTDEDELWGLGTLYHKLLGQNYSWAQTRTLRSLKEEADRYADVSMGETILRDIMDSGVHVITLRLETGRRPYWAALEQELDRKFRAIGAKRACEPHEEFWEDFYDDMYSPDYASELGMQEYQLVFENGCQKLKDIEGRYFNVRNGERLTTGQPEKYDGTVYFFGPCIIVGWGVEDAHTLESRLQELFNLNGIPRRVVNCGSWSNELHLFSRICSTEFRRGDIAVIYDDGKVFPGIPSVDLGECLERENIPAKWLWDLPLHPNYKVFKLWAKKIFDSIPRSVLTASASGDVCWNDGMYSLLTSAYRKRYFSDIDPQGVTGAIVMNCDPFTLGHRYLIEKASERLDRLIVFVVEEDLSLFTFRERYTMVTEGTRDLKNVMVVPSGGLILSRQTFPEYFIKTADEDTVKNAEFDITLFAEGIASSLSIRCRFVGEEKHDPVTNEYNRAMKRILPLYGIEVIELPRKTIGGTSEPISASAVREKLTAGDRDGIRDLVPQSTLDILASSCG